MEKAGVEEAEHEDEDQTEQEDEHEAAQVPGGPVPATEHGGDPRGPGAHILGGHVADREAAVFGDDAGASVQGQDARPPV